jgi:hypothetical protein
VTKQRRTNADKLRKMVDGERLGATTALEIMQEWEDVREHAEALAAIADAMENVTSEIESYQEETGRDEKADARESALGAIEELLSAIEEYEALPDMPELSESGPIQVIDVKEVPTRELTV